MSDSDPHTSEIVDPVTSRSITRFVNVAFFWCMGGVAVIYGVRFYHDIPIHPSFLPIIGAVFAAILSFTLVIVLRIYTGPIDFEAGSVKMKGATGPIILWCVCFLTVAYGLFLLGIGDAIKAGPSSNYISCSTGEAVLKECRGQSTSGITASKSASAAAP